MSDSFGGLEAGASPELRSDGGGPNLGPFALLFATLLLFMFLIPFVSRATGVFASAPSQSVMLTALILASVYAVSRDRWLFWIAAGLAVPAILGIWIDSSGGGAAGAISGHGAPAVFLAYAIAALLLLILREQQVTVDTILGSVSSYLLIGVAFMVVTALLEDLQAGSYTVLGQSLSELHSTRDARVPTLLYFSFVTLSTAGYGDVLPASQAAQMLAAAEAVVGQMFLAILVARLVGLHISASREGRG